MEELFEGLFEAAFRSKIGFIICLLLGIGIFFMVKYYTEKQINTHKNVIEYNDTTYYTDSNIVKLDNNTIKFHNGGKWIVTNEYTIIK